MHYFSTIFWYRTLHVLDRFTVHRQQSSTVYTAVGICDTGYADCLLARSGSHFETTYFYKALKAEHGNRCLSTIFALVLTTSQGIHIQNILHCNKNEWWRGANS
jgi:hypothetical protein